MSNNIKADSLATQTAVLHAAGIGIQVISDALEQAHTQLDTRDARGRANLERLNRITLRLYELAMELTAKGGKVSASKLSKELLAIRSGS